MPIRIQHRNEAQTRRDLIDPRLVHAGPTDPARYQCRAVEEWPTDVGPADYALCEGGDLVAIVEGEKETAVEGLYCDSGADLLARLRETPAAAPRRRGHLPKVASLFE